MYSERKQGRLRMINLSTNQYTFMEDLTCSEHSAGKRSRQLSPTLQLNDSIPGFARKQWKDPSG